MPTTSHRKRQALTTGPTFPPGRLLHVTTDRPARHRNAVPSLALAVGLALTACSSGATESAGEETTPTGAEMELGHLHGPDENLPPSLGLVESTDAAETWEPVSLLGEADLHSIEMVGENIYAYDSTSPRTRRTRTRSGH